jgi:toxin-antitoxin system PIN domain toxin
VIVLDVNVLVAAFRADHAHHPLARPWLESSLSSGTPILVPDFAWVGFVRLVTNNHIFEVPSTPTESFEFVDAVCGTPSYVGIPGLSGGLTAFRELVLESDAWGNLIPDAYLASVARAHAAPIASFDRDFRRFDGVEIIVPGA